MDWIKIYSAETANERDNAGTPAIRLGDEVAYVNGDEYITCTVIGRTQSSITVQENWQGKENPEGEIHILMWDKWLKRFVNGNAILLLA